MKRLAIVILALLLPATALGALWLWIPDKPRAWLEAHYLHAPGDMVEVAGLKLHVRDTGPRTAPAVIMVHGFGSSLHTWEPWAHALEDDYRVIRSDLPGSGLSEPDPAGDYTDARMIEVLTALMDRVWRQKGQHDRQFAGLLGASPPRIPSA